MPEMQKEPESVTEQETSAEAHSGQFARTQGLIGGKAAFDVDEGVIEIPVVAAASLDSVLCGGSHISTVQKRRAAIETKLGISRKWRWTKRQSMGPGRVYALTQAPVLVLLQAVMRNASKAFVSKFEEQCQESLAPLFRMHTIEALLDSATETIKKDLIAQIESRARDSATGERKKGSISPLVNNALLHLFETNQQFRNIARDYTDIVDKLARTVEGLERKQGHIVKFDDDKEKALVLIEGGEEKEYRWVKCDLMDSMGLIDEGQAFVLWEQTTDADHRMSLFVPAIEAKLMPDEAFEKEAALLREAETPLRDYEAPSY